MGNDRNLKEFSSTIAAVIRRLRIIIKDAENTDLDSAVTLMRVRENADIVLNYMNKMHEALEPDESG
jgi:hypothetical protein